MMREKTIGCLPIVNAGKLVGILTSVDLLDFFLDITGCREKDSARVAIRLEDRPGNLSKLLSTVHKLEGRIVSVVTPQHQQDEAEGMRSVIVRYRAADPSAVDAALKAEGYRFISEDLPII